MQLLPFDPTFAAMVASWHEPHEAVTAERVIEWASEDWVHPFGLHDQGALVAYGQLWVDDDETEVELARLIVDPALRGQGICRILVPKLIAQARLYYENVILRTLPDNQPALRCYAATGFQRVSPELEAQWNAPQPTEYVWLSLSAP